GLSHVTGARALFRNRTPARTARPEQLVTDSPQDSGPNGRDRFPPARGTRSRRCSFESRSVARSGSRQGRPVTALCLRWSRADEHGRFSTWEPRLASREYKGERVNERSL